MSTLLKKSFHYGLLFTAVAFWLSHSAARAQTVPTIPVAVTLWNEPAPKGQWAPFGPALQDSEVPDGEKGLRIDVDWAQSTWGVGARYATDLPDVKIEPLPKLAGFRTLRFEARCEVDDGTTITVELVRQKDDKAFPLAKAYAKALTPSWQTVEVKVPQDFPALSAETLPGVDGIRLLFQHAGKTGRNTVAFRNVTFAP